MEEDLEKNGGKWRITWRRMGEGTVMEENLEKNGGGNMEENRGENMEKKISAGGFSLAALQRYIKNKDYQPDLKNGYFLKLIEEVGELAEVIRKERRAGRGESIKGTMEEELYDVLYYVLALANVYGVDLEKSFREKEKINDVKYGRDNLPDSGT